MFFFFIFFFLSRILVISGSLPKFNREEDVEEVAISAIATVTGMTGHRKDILNAHRQGRKKDLIYVE